MNANSEKTQLHTADGGSRRNAAGGWNGDGRIPDTYRRLGITTVSDAPFCGAEEFGILVGYKTGLYSDRVIIMSAGTEA